MLRKLIGCCLVLLAGSSFADEVQVAVAANFAAPMKQIALAFEQTTGHKALLSFGATGKFYAQIKNAAPFDILLAADQTTPTQLAQEQAAVAGSQFTYAIGKLVLWSAAAGLVDAQGAILKHGSFAHLALASPKQAPYGAAALETLTALNLVKELSPKFVQGESIGQTYTFVATGNAELGFVALSQVWENNQIKSGSAWIVPENLYAPLRQDAILLKHGKDNSAALALLAYLKTDAAKNIIRSYGYRF
ncbi:molybdate ABC transporter substrate-binding protein [Solimicrobium silvestre]|nr:molybdate ABC transporter substrate-binding protein [Solimicrobium silvestre]